MPAVRDNTLMRSNLNDLHSLAGRTRIWFIFIQKKKVKYVAKLWHVSNFYFAFPFKLGRKIIA